MESTNTFLRRALQQLPWDGPRFGALFGYLSGLVPDSLAEGHLAVAKMLVPLPETSVDVLPHIARFMGIPLYAVHVTSSPAGYVATLARLRLTLAVHAVAGSMAGLASELTLAGLVDVTIVNDDGLGAHRAEQSFDVECSNSTAPETYGGGATYGDGTIYGRQVPSDVAQGILAVMAYFRPAGARFKELVEA